MESYVDSLLGRYRHKPNCGDLTLFKAVRPTLTRLARAMYGETCVKAVTFGRVNQTAYVLIILNQPPTGAEGSASEEFFGLNARFYEVLKSGFDAKLSGMAGGESRGQNDRGRGGEAVVLSGGDLTEAFEVQVEHPISGRCLVDTLEKQRLWRGA